jgi:putative transposase
VLTQICCYGIDYLGVIFLPRTARTKSESGIYHIIMRGINRQILFEEEEDSVKFIQTIQKYREICEYKLYAYCLMGNHLHLLLMEGKDPLGTVMRRICSSYVIWYNKKYNRVGYLFQDRFKSEPIEDATYFLTVLRYIFQNPVKAGIVTRVEDHVWTNYSDYFEESSKTDIDFVLSLFHTDRKKAISSFLEFINQENNDQCLDVERRQITDAEAVKIIKKHCKVDHSIDLQKFDVNKRNQCLKDLKKVYGLSIRQIERLTGISRGVIQKI